MTKNTLNFIVDVAATVAMLIIIATGLLIFFVLVPGSRGGHGLEFWGMSRHEWGDVHFWTSMALIALIILHVLLHWDWVCYTVYRWISPEGFKQKRLKFGHRLAIGLVFLAVVTGLVGGFVGYAAATVQRGADDHDAHFEHDDHGDHDAAHDDGYGEQRRRGRGQGRGGGEGRGRQ